ncbi:MAG: cupin [Oscillospiraceae bacterium]|nr:cupin [Oscillospiraceae bacterium]
MRTLFDKFDEGRYISPCGDKAFADLAWNAHPTFEGVELKHLLTAADTDGKFSYHLVRIAPGMSIGEHIHADQLETHEVIAGGGVCINEGMQIPYECGTMTILRQGTPHSVTAGSDGLYLFAKFIPALC